MIDVDIDITKTKTTVQREGNELFGGGTRVQHECECFEGVHFLHAAGDGSQDVAMGTGTGAVEVTKSEAAEEGSVREYV